MPVPEITVEQLQQLKAEQADFVLIDVREPFEYDLCHLDGQLIPLQTLPTQFASLDKHKQTIVYCRSGGRSAYAVQFLMQQGFTNVSNLSGGILQWIDKIDPTLKKY